MKLVLLKLTEEEKQLPKEDLLRKARHVVFAGFNELLPDLGTDVVRSFQKVQRGGELRAIDDMADVMQQAYAVRCEKMLNDIADLLMDDDRGQ